MFKLKQYVPSKDTTFRMSRNTTSPRTLTAAFHDDGADIFRVIDMKAYESG